MQIDAVVKLRVKATVNKNVDLYKFLGEETEWLAEPKNTDGCVTKIQFVRAINMTKVKVRKK
jgi:hypothetical protein